MTLWDHTHVSKKRDDKDMCAIKKRERERKRHKNSFCGNWSINLF